MSGTAARQVVFMENIRWWSLFAQFTRLVSQRQLVAAHLVTRWTADCATMKPATRFYANYYFLAWMEALVRIVADL